MRFPFTGIQQRNARYISDLNALPASLEHDLLLSAHCAQQERQPTHTQAERPIYGVLADDTRDIPLVALKVDAIAKQGKHVPVTRGD
jgi:hypothetical protein